MSPTVYHYHTLTDPNISALPPLPAHIVATSLVPCLDAPETLLNCSLVSKAFRTATLPEIQRRLISANEGFFTPEPHLSALRERLSSPLFAALSGPRNIYLLAGCMNLAARIAIYDAVMASGECRGRLASQVVLTLPRAAEIYAGNPLHEFSDPYYAQFWNSVEELRFRLGQYTNANLVNSIHCAEWQYLNLTKLVTLVLDDDQIFVNPEECKGDDPIKSMVRFLVCLKVALGGENSQLQHLTIGSDSLDHPWTESQVMTRRTAIIDFLHRLSPRLQTVRLSFDILKKRKRWPCVCSGTFLRRLWLSRYDHARHFKRLKPWELNEGSLTSWSNYDTVTVPPEKGVKKKVFLIEPHSYREILDLPPCSAVTNLLASVQCFVTHDVGTDDLPPGLQGRIPSVIGSYYETLTPDSFPPWIFKVPRLFLVFKHEAINSRVHGGSILSALLRRTQALDAAVTDLVINWRFKFDVDIAWHLLGRKVERLSFTANLLRGRRRPECGCRVIKSKALEGLNGVGELVVAGSELVGCEECWDPEILQPWRDCVRVGGLVVLRTWVDPNIRESVKQEVKGWPEKYSKRGKVEWNGKWGFNLWDR